MPKWGLTQQQREARPWNLNPEYLAPAKVITDPIHGDVFVTELERIFIDTEPVQRLRRIKQLGNTDLVYPGATHSRFSHSLGAVRVAQDLIDQVLDQRNNPKPQPDLFMEWEQERLRSSNQIYERIRSQLAKGERRVNVKDLRYTGPTVDRRIAEAVVAVRLGALLHDLCHVPFGHSLEDDLSILTPHDKNEPRFERVWARLGLPEKLDRQLREGGLFHELRRLILSKVDGQPAFRYPFVEDIVGNTICADLLDYLERDHRQAGLPVALGRRFVSAFYVMPSGDPDLGQHMVLKITRPDGRERTDIVTEVLKYLRYRYELSERALVHHAKLAADAMIGKALEMWFDTLWIDEAYEYLAGQQSSKRRGRFRAPLWLRERDVGAIRRRIQESRGDEARNRIDDAARTRLDDLLSRSGDDALLERLSELEDVRGHPRRVEAIRHLARGLLHRRLYKQIGTQHRPAKAAEAMFRDWGGADKRREVEEDAARWAGLKHRWQVLLWVPPPTMRLKVADVRVDAGDAGIMTFHEYESQGRRRGTDIYEAHRALWAISAYIHPDYAEDDLAIRMVIARLAERMNMTFTRYEGELGRQAYLWPDRLAARQAIAAVRGIQEPDRRPDLVKRLMDAVRTEQVQARGPARSDSWAALYSRYQGAAAAVDELRDAS